MQQISDINMVLLERILLLLLLLLLHPAFLLLPFAFFALKDARIRLLILGILSSCFYLVYFQRGIEERYTLPLLPFVLMIGVMTINYVIVRFKKVKNNKISFFN